MKSRIWWNSALGPVFLVSYLYIIHLKAWRFFNWGSVWSTFSGNLCVFHVSRSIVSLFETNDVLRMFRFKYKVGTWNKVCNFDCLKSKIRVTNPNNVRLFQGQPFTVSDTQLQEQSLTYRAFTPGQRIFHHLLWEECKTLPLVQLKSSNRQM